MTPRQNLPDRKTDAIKHKFAEKLSSSQRAKLKGMAHSKKPVIQIGGQGLTPALIAEIVKALQAHELIKVQLPGQSDADTKNSLSEKLAEQLPNHCHLVNRIGRNVILFLEKDPKDSPKITLKSL